MPGMIHEIRDADLWYSAPISQTESPPPICSPEKVEMSNACSMTSILRSRLRRCDTKTAGYLEARQIPHFDAYLSFTGGPLLRENCKQDFGAKRAIPFYCSVDPDTYFGMTEMKLTLGT